MDCQTGRKKGCSWKGAPLEKASSNKKIPSCTLQKDAAKIILKKENMKIKEGFVLRTIVGENVVIGEGLAQINFNKMICLNSSAAYLWREVEGKEFSKEDLASLLLKEYDIDEATASKDAATIAQKWIEAGIVEQ